MKNINLQKYIFQVKNTRLLQLSTITFKLRKKSATKRPNGPNFFFLGGGVSTNTTLGLSYCNRCPSWNLTDADMTFISSVFLPSKKKDTLVRSLKSPNSSGEPNNFKECLLNYKIVSTYVTLMSVSYEYLFLRQHTVNFYCPLVCNRNFS